MIRRHLERIQELAEAPASEGAGSDELSERDCTRLHVLDHLDEE